MISKQPFGRTGHESTRVVFGSYALSNATQAEAGRVLDLLLEHGINHIDTAPRYGDAELRIGPCARNIVGARNAGRLLLDCMKNR